MAAALPWRTGVCPAGRSSAHSASAPLVGRGIYLASRGFHAGPRQDSGSWKQFYSEEVFLTWVPFRPRSIPRNNSGSTMVTPHPCQPFLGVPSPGCLCVTVLGRPVAGVGLRWVFHSPPYISQHLLFWGGGGGLCKPLPAGRWA